jgi:thioredoxin-related protein
MFCKGQFGMSLRLIIFSLFLLVSSTALATADTVLIMVEEKGCVWCGRWNKEIAHIYPKTDEGKAAPLRRIDINATRPTELTFLRALTYTPTFVLVVDGQEISRIEGYPGEDFFWGLLRQMLSKADIDITE